MSTAHLRRFCTYLAVLTALFIVVFAGADFISAQRETRLRLYLDAELDLPLIPSMVLAYLSVQLLFLMVPFVLRERAELRALACSLGVVIGVAGIAFVALPAELGYPAPQDLGGWAPVLRFADRLNLDFNLIPSLHVAFTVLCVSVIAQRLSRWAGAAMWAWAAAIIASTVLTHQHHLLDLVSGLALGVAARHFVFDALLARPAPARYARPAGG